MGSTAISGSKQEDLSGGGLIRSYGGWQNLIDRRHEHGSKIGDERILGDSDFVERMLKEDDLQLEAKARMKKAGWTLEKLMTYVCDRVDVELEQITHRGRDNQLSLVRALICYWGSENLGVAGTQIAVRLKMSQQAASKASKRGKTYCLVNGIRLDIL